MNCFKIDKTNLIGRNSLRTSSYMKNDLARILAEFTRKKQFERNGHNYFPLHANLTQSRLKTNQIKIENSLADINFRWPSSNMKLKQIQSLKGGTGKLNNSSNHTSEQFGRKKPKASLIFQKYSTWILVL